MNSNTLNTDKLFFLMSIIRYKIHSYITKYQINQFCFIHDFDKLCFNRQLFHNSSNHLIISKTYNIISNITRKSYIHHTKKQELPITMPSVECFRHSWLQAIDNVKVKNKQTTRRLHFICMMIIKSQCKLIELKSAGSKCMYVYVVGKGDSSVSRLIISRFLSFFFSCVSSLYFNSQKQSNSETNGKHKIFLRSWS